MLRETDNYEARAGYQDPRRKIQNGTRTEDYEAGARRVFGKRVCACGHSDWEHTKQVGCVSCACEAFNGKNRGRK